MILMIMKVTDVHFAIETDRNQDGTAVNQMIGEKLMIEDMTVVDQQKERDVHLMMIDVYQMMTHEMVMTVD